MYLYIYVSVEVSAMANKRVIELNNNESFNMYCKY